MTEIFYLIFELKCSVCYLLLQYISGCTFLLLQFQQQILWKSLVKKHQILEKIACLKSLSLPPMMMMMHLTFCLNLLKCKICLSQVFLLSFSSSSCLEIACQHSYQIIDEQSEGKNFHHLSICSFWECLNLSFCSQNTKHRI